MEINKEEFVKLIKSIGFRFFINLDYGYYDYKSYRIYLESNYYNFYNGSGWTFHIKFDDLSVFKKELRSIKLKQLLR